MNLLKKKLHDFFFPFKIAVACHVDWKMKQYINYTNNHGYLLSI